MKKIAKIALAIALAMPAAAISFQVDKIEASAIISGDYAYELNDDGTITIMNYGGSEKDLNIPSTIDGLSVTKIGYGAFAECKSIETLTIPRSVKVIEDNAFSQCSQLTNVDLHDSLVRMGANAFRGCSSLTSVIIPNSLKELSTGTFFDCTSLTEVEIPEGITSIGGNVFGNCYALTSVTLPSTLNAIGDSMFANCVSLNNVVIKEGTTVIGTNAFAGCLSLTSISIPDTVSTIGQSAFKDCISLETIALPDSVKGLGYAAFSGCASLKNVNIPAGLTRLTNAVFSGCSSLETIVIPDTVTELGDSVFSGCIALKNVTLADSIVEIGKETFQHCASLERITLPSKITAIPIGLFRYCDSLTQVIVPSGVTEIAGYAFADCQNLESVTLPNTLVDGKLAVGIFSNSPQVEVTVPAGSVAYNYMVNLGNAVKYKVLDNDIINLDKSEITLNLGDVHTYVALFSNYNTIANDALTWESSDPAVASVTADGKIEGLEVGKTTITATHSNGLIGISEVTVEDVNIPMEKIELSYTESTLQRNQTLALRATITPSTTTDNKTLTWESSDVNVATVSATGVVSARKPGTVRITATSETGVSAVSEIEVISSIENVSLNLTAMVLDAGTQQQLRATINPIDTTDDKTLVWSSSNTNVATVDNEGNVEAIAEGYATISAVSVNGKRAECSISVNPEALEVPIISVSLNASELTLLEGGTETLIATINPNDTTDDQTITWASTDELVATVNSEGMITAIKAGETTITATTTNGKTASCAITVDVEEVAITSVELNKESMLLRGTGSEKLIATINPANTTNDKTLTWVSSNTAVATVDEHGLVSAITPGEATITVTTSNALSDSVSVTVVEQDKTELEAAIEEAANHVDSNYTKATLDILKSVVNIASGVLDDKEATQAEIDEQEELVEDAIANLKERAQVASITTLNDLIKIIEENAPLFTVEEFANMNSLLVQAKTILAKDVENISEEEVTSVTNAIKAELEVLDNISARKQLQVALDNTNIILNGDLSTYVEAEIEILQIKAAQAQVLINNANSTSSEIETATSELQDLLSKLTILKVERSHLEALIEQTEVLDASNFTNTSWQNYLNAVAKAEAFLEEPYATQEKIDAAYEELVEAFVSLRAKVNKTTLALKIELVQGIVDNKDLYVEDTISNIDNLLADAKVAYANEAISEDALSLMNSSLMTAIMNARYIAE